jgi:peptidoglycan/LPS O-acetylase OafA/YrhL
MGLPWGWVGVEVFFVLSGFLITGILFDTQNEPHRVKNFYIRRSLRIFPLYYLTLLGVFAAGFLFQARLDRLDLAWFLYVGNLLPFLHPAAPLSPFAYLASGDMVSPSHPGFSLLIGHFWTLCVEEQFYLCWPALIFLVRRRRTLLWIALAIILAVPSARLLVQATAPHWMLDNQLLNRVTLFRVDAFAYGAVIALWLRGPSAHWLRRASMFLRWIALLGVFLVIVLEAPEWLRHGFARAPSWIFTWGLLAADVFSFCLVLECLQTTAPFARFCGLPGLRWLGRISYGAYVFHYIPIALWEELPVRLHLPHPTICAAAASLSATILLAWCSFRFFETPFILLKDRWTQRLAAKLATRQAVPTSNP